jgi:hypothetical protein
MVSGSPARSAGPHDGQAWVVTLDRLEGTLTSARSPAQTGQVVFGPATDSVTTHRLGGEPVEPWRWPDRRSRQCCATAPGTPCAWATAWLLLLELLHYPVPIHLSAAPT